MEFILNSPLPGRARETPEPFTAEEEGESFMALMNQSGV